MATSISLIPPAVPSKKKIRAQGSTLKQASGEAMGDIGAYQKQKDDRPK